jgi:hypothetical protein
MSDSTSFSIRSTTVEKLLSSLATAVASFGDFRANRLALDGQDVVGHFDEEPLLRGQPYTVGPNLRDYYPKAIPEF